MKPALLTACAVLCAGFPVLPSHAGYYVWDNQNTNGIWNDPGNWGLTNNSGYNVEPTAADSANFVRGANFSPAGTITLTNDGFALNLRQEFSRFQRAFTIHPGQTADRTLTLSGTGSALIDGANAAVDFALDGTPNANGARLKLKINGSGTGIRTALNKAVTLTVSCDVSGAGGFILNGGEDGPGRLKLTGVNTYTGPTTVNAGVLLVNGSTAAGSTVTVNNGGILAGVGTIHGPVTVNAGGLISPGVNSQAPLLGNLTLNNNLTLAGDLHIELNKASAPANDTITVSGNLNNTGAGSVHVINLGAPLQAGDRFNIFNKPLVNGQALLVLSAGHEIWTNKLAVDGSIEVLAATNTPLTGDPTRVLTWKGAVTTDPPWKAPMQTAANWIENEAPAPHSANVLVFQGDILVPYNWPYIDTNYGTSILIFSNNTVLNSIKILAGSNNTVRLGSYVRQDTAQPCYYGITGEVPITWNAGAFAYSVTNAYFTNVLGDASCGRQTEFQCTGGRLDVYGVIRDGDGTSSRLVKSGNHTLNLTGDLTLGNDANTYTGGTLVNAGPIKMQKLPGFNCIPGDVTVNGNGSLVINIGGGEQIADNANVTLNHAGRLDLAGQPETVQTVQSHSPNASIGSINSTLTVAPTATGNYNSGVGISDFAGAISGSGTVIKNGSGTWGLLGANSISKVTINAGTLKLHGKTGTGAVTVNPGGHLIGKGTVAGVVTVAGGATIGAGSSPDGPPSAGALTLPNGLNMSAAGDGPTNIWELATLKDDATGLAGTDFDQIIITGGTLALGTQATLDVRFLGSASPPDGSNAFWQTPHQWTVIRLNGGANPGSSPDGPPSQFARIKNSTHPAGYFTVTNAGGSILLKFTPTGEPPSIIVPPRSFGIHIGQTGRFSVTAAGAPPLAYQWRANGTNIAGATTSTLTIPAVQAADQGLYSVRVTNGFGSLWSSEARLVLTAVVAAGRNNFDQTWIPPSATNVTALSAGDWHNLALCANGTVLGWGNNWEGQSAVPSGLNQATAIAAGGYHSLALDPELSVLPWGANYSGQASVPGGAGKVMAIAAGTWHNLALRTNGTVVAWGDNSSGQTNVPAGLNNVVAIAAGALHSLALKANGQVVGWGSNLDPLGNYAGQASVPLNLSGVIAIAAGDYHSLAVRADGSVVAWGYNGQGQAVAPAGLSNVLAVAGGGYHSLALKHDRTVVGWGDNTHGQISGLAGLADVTAIAAGEYHSLALTGEPPDMRPRITLVTSSGAGMVTVHYTNSLPGKNYVLSCCTNLNNANWFTAATKAAAGTSDFQIHSSAQAGPRYYRIYFTPPGTN